MKEWVENLKRETQAIKYQLKIQQMTVFITDLRGD